MDRSRVSKKDESGRPAVQSDELVSSTQPKVRLVGGCGRDHCHDKLLWGSGGA
jgi:hypothetical protein